MIIEYESLEELKLITPEMYKIPKVIIRPSKAFYRKMLGLGK